MLCKMFFPVIWPFIVSGFTSRIWDLPLVGTPYGKIAGTFHRSAGNEIFSAFLDIPYAQPPVGNLRFKDALPPKKWKGILLNLENDKICYQGGRNDSRETEDCLYLNVYTTGVSKDKMKRLPVIIWIHGGSFQDGSGAMDEFGPQFFMDYEVVLVTINYRLGPLGFLTTGDGVIPGNLGLKDQLMALKWVKENIQYFGGDSNKITVMGQSAGAASVGYQLLTEKSEGLFRAAIMHSGSPLTCWSLTKNPKDVAYKLGSLLDDSFSANNSSQELLTLLQRTNASVIKEKAMKMVSNQAGICYDGFTIAFPPTEEPENASNAIIQGFSHEKIKDGNFSKVPLLIGINSQELLLFEQVIENVALLSAMYDINPSQIPNNNLNMPATNRQPAGIKIRQIYTNETFSSNFANTVKFGSDSLFTTPVAEHAYLQSSYSDVFFYQFSYRGKIGELLINTTFKGAEGVGHQEELEYLFRSPYNWNETNFPKSDIITRKRMLQMWTDFAKTSNPTPKKLELLQDVVWPKVKQNNFAYLDINNNLNVTTDPKKYKEWSAIYSDYTSEHLETY